MRNIAKVQGLLIFIYLCFHIHSHILFYFYLEYQKNRMFPEDEQRDWQILGAGGREVCWPNSAEWASRSATSDRRIGQQFARIVSYYIVTWFYEALQ